MWADCVSDNQADIAAALDAVFCDEKILLENFGIAGLWGMVEVKL